MALQKVGGRALAVAEEDKKPIYVKKPDKNTLDEDAYTGALEKIIVRDFFPDTLKLKAQSEYLEALQKNDTVKLREIHIKYGPKRGSVKTPSIYSTPATFETPSSTVGGPKQTPTTEGGSKEPTGEKTHDDPPTHNPEPSEVQVKDDTSLTLDKFLSKNTSEDNASFVEIMAENEQKHKVKHAWLYEQEEKLQQEQEERLALPSIEQQAILSSSQHIDTWKYTPKNTVMYVPDGAEHSAKEKIDFQKIKPRVISHKNTRFESNPFNTEKNRETIHIAASQKAAILMGKIGADGKELIPDESPKVDGFGFVATPSPAPGVDASPLMTWGEIEGSPFRLDGGDTPVSHTPGPVFKIPNIPRRDRLAFDLAEKASKQHRAKKQTALKAASATFNTPSPKFGSPRTNRLKTLSPAAQRLASSKLGIRTNTDQALRASYTPSPTHRLPGDKTPLSLTPKGKTPTRTPKSRGSTPKTTPKRDSSEPMSLTDNLLNLPKRARATDFF